MRFKKKKQNRFKKLHNLYEIKKKRKIKIENQNDFNLYIYKMWHTLQYFFFSCLFLRKKILLNFVCSSFCVDF